MDLNMMMRDQARNGLQTQLEKATTDGDIEAVKKITGDLEKLAVATAPKAPPFGDAEIRAELDKQPWFGTDPKKSAKAVEFGKTLDPKKFATAAAFADALVKAVDEEFKPARAAPAEGDDDKGEENEDDKGEENDDDKDRKETPRTRRTDAPGEAEASGRAPRRTSGPWMKLADAPPDVQKEVKRAAERFVSSNATKEQREKYISKALESHYATHQRAKGKK